MSNTDHQIRNRTSLTRRNGLRSTMPVPVTINKSHSTHVEPLLNEDRDEALAFLARRPRHTVIMAGLLRHYGPVVPLAQGMFYTCRDARGRLEGLALVGRATMFEAQNGAAISALARGARRSPAVRMIMGEADELETFWRCYIAGRQEPRLFCREIFYESSRQFSRAAGVDGLRQATLDDLDQIVQAHAQMVFEESGVNPLADDAEGFRHRCAQRVEQGQVWTLIDKGELIFKADVLTQTPEASYIEGVWVNPAHRLKGYGRNCWASLSRTLLDKAPAFCWFVNAQNSTARSFYDRVGAVSLGEYNKVYL